MTTPKTKLAATMVAATLATFARPCFALSDADAVAIRQQIEQMRKEYETRIRELERRLDAAERTAKAAKAAAEQAKTPSVARPTPKPPAAANAFNPAISGVLNGTVGTFSRNPKNASIPGFVSSPESSRGDRGFSLGESEISLSANIDQALFGNLVVSLNGDNEASVEEAYIQSTSLPAGFTVKAGRFFSGIGYLNQKHAHDWEFIDAPLPYAAMLNGQYGDDGVQLRWLAPTDFFLEFGGELFRGDSFPAANGDGGGKGGHSLFVHFGDDFNVSSSWSAGLSYLHTVSNDRESGGTPDVFNGHDDLAIADVVYKWAPNGNRLRKNLTVSGEYFFRNETGTFNGTALDTNQSGWYAQAVYQFMPRWRVGLRYDQLNSDDVPVALAGTELDNLGHTPRRGSALLEYDTSEFGRFRLQYSRDDSDVETSDVLVLQYTVIFGPHGAHIY